MLRVTIGIDELISSRAGISRRATDNTTQNHKSVRAEQSALKLQISGPISAKLTVKQPLIIMYKIRGDIIRNGNERLRGCPFHMKKDPSE